MVSTQKAPGSKNNHFPARTLAVFGGLVSLALAGGLPAQTLAYTKGRTIYTASAVDGKNERKICVGDDPNISDDGRFIVYTRNLTVTLTAARPVVTSKRAIILRELATGTEKILPAGSAEQVYGALWSPDDRWIAFNALTEKGWQPVVVHPDGTGFRLATAKFGENSVGGYLAGWNRHAKAVLVQNLDQIAQINPETGEIAWQRPLKELIDHSDISSAWHCTISADGRLLITTREVNADEIKGLDESSSYLVLTDFPGGKSRRVTPPKFGVGNFWLVPSGESVLFRGFGQKDVLRRKGSGGLKIRSRIYRYDFATEKLTSLIEGGDTPSSSRD